MIKNRALNIAEPTSEGSQLIGKPEKQKELVKTLLSSKSEKIVVGNVSGRSKSDSSLEPSSSKKRRNITSGNKPFTIHEDVADDKQLVVSARPSSTADPADPHSEKLPQIEGDRTLDESSIRDAVTSKHPETYWELEAESLRKKLDVALEENRMVWEELIALKSVNLEMKEALDEAVLIADVLREQMDKEDARKEAGTQTDVDM